jgi:23S rRNA (pseudouridine1915-N3)-methyltransferase
MKIDIYYHDKFKFSFEKNLAEIYFERLKSLPKSIIASINYKKINSKELKKIISENQKKSYLVFLDEKGKNLSSKQFSDFIFSKVNKNLIFFIGATDGFDREILKLSDFSLSLGKMTYTHSFALIILLEQIYRSATIKTNHPYHRE